MRKCSIPPGRTLPPPLRRGRGMVRGVHSTVTPVPPPCLASPLKAQAEARRGEKLSLGLFAAARKRTLQVAKCDDAGGPPRGPRHFTASGGGAARPRRRAARAARRAARDAPPRPRGR